MTRGPGVFILLASIAGAVSAEPAVKDAWVYKQGTGELFLAGKLVARGYSGHGKGLNNPDREAERNVGPLPRGEWQIGAAFQHPRLGPTVMRLTPVRHKAHGRSAFLIHGDNKKGDRSASEGCIILGPAVRKTIAGSTIKKLIVVR